MSGKLKAGGVVQQAPMDHYRKQSDGEGSSNQVRSFQYGQPNEQGSPYQAPLEIAPRQKIKYAKMHEYNEDEGFVMNIDIASGIPKQFPEIKLAYSEYKGNIAYGNPGEVGPLKTKTDPNN